MHGRGQVIEGFRLAPQQKQVWRLHQDDGQEYYAQCAILIGGDLKSKALESALRKMTRRYEILRTTLDWFPGVETPLQIVLENQPFSCRRVDLADLRPASVELAVGDLLKEESRPFDLKRGLLARFCLARLSTSRHVLLISLHALCADSWTLRNLFREIARFYAAELEGRELSDDPVQYLQFSEWQNGLLEEKTEEIKGRRPDVGAAVPELVLPLESSRAGDSTSACHRFAPEAAALVLDSRFTERIETTGRALGCAVPDLLLAAWQVLLWRLSAEEEIVTECLFNGRQFDELHGALGLFARYLPARVTVGPGLRFDEATANATESLQRAYTSQKVFLLEMAGRNAAERTGLIGFEYEEWPDAERVGAIRFSYWKQRCRIDRFKLKLGGYRKPDGLTIEMQYDPAIFSRGGIELMRERYLTLIEHAVKDRRILIEDLEIIGGRERERLLITWNETEERSAESRSLHELIAEQAHLRPESVAVIYEEERLSYRELEGRANQLANHLRSLGVGPESVVGLYLGRSTEMMVGWLGILKAGGAYLPLEPGQPKDRLEIMLEDASASVIVTKRELAGSLRAVGREVVMLDEDREEIAGWSREAPESGTSFENLAYVIYTSGSTGRPKGVMVRHGAIVNLMEWLNKAIYAGAVEGLTVGVNASMAFDASVKQLIQLGSGRRICIVPESVRVDAESMLEYLREQGVEALDCTPSQLRWLAEAGLGRGEGGPRMVLVGGEAIDVRSWKEMSESREARYYNVYGPTECTVDATACEVREGSEATIGRPISNTQIHILDEYGRVTPAGMAGEIYIGGAGVGRGYVGEAAKTAEKFVPDGFGSGSGGRLYRTGDVGRYLEDGRIVYEGRRDEQVKVRGYRIELGEIAEVLRSHPGVGEAVVTLREDEAGQKRLVGYVVGKREGAADGNARRRMPNGVAIAEQNRNETDYLYEEIYKKRSYFKHGIGLRDGGCVFDVGANIGLFSLFVSQNRKGVRVYAFEPLPPIYETLRINTELYGGRGIKLYRMGLGDAERREWYTYYRGYSMMSGESRYAAPAEDVEVIKKYLENERGGGWTGDQGEEAWH